jgi:hypothetical protein
MSIRVARARAVYLLVALNVTMLVVFGAVTLHLTNVQTDRGRGACERGNVLRDNTRANTIAIARLAAVIAEYAQNQKIKAEFQKAVPELQRRAALPLVQHQRCIELFP